MNGIIAHRNAQLFPQCRDVDADGIAEAVHAIVPNMVDQFPLTDWTALIEQQIL